jgi:hypothetical protein
MSFIAAATAVGGAVLGTGAAAGIGSAIVGGALLGAGAGGLYSGITGDGDIGKSMLTGAALGAGGAGIGSALGFGGAGTAAANTAGATGATTAGGAGAATETGLGLVGSDVGGAASAKAAAAAGTAPTGLAAYMPSGTQALLGYGALKAFSPNKNVPGNPGPDEYDKRLAKYHLSPDYKPYEAAQPNPYYKAQYAAGGLAMGGMPPQTNFANPSSYEEGTSQYSMATDPMSGNIANRMAEGGVTGGGEMQLNVPISIGGGGGNLGGGGGGYGGYSSGAGYAPPGGPQGGSAGSLASLGRGAQQMQPPGGSAPQAQGAQAQGAQMNMQENAQSAQGMSADVNGFTPIQTNQGTLLAGQFLQGLSGIPDQKAGGAMGNQYGMQQIQAADAKAANQYMGPEYANPIGMASGGIAYAKGGHLSASAGIPDTGIYYDSDLVTRGEQAFGASEAKNKQLFKRAGLKYAAGPKSGIEKLGGGFSEYGASGGLSHLGGYSDGGRMLKGPGDGMSDDIPAMIGKKQPARLADGEFVVPADVVSHLGNGSTDAGAKKLYGMMDKIRKARTGKKAQGKQINPNKFLPT